MESDCGGSLSGAIVLGHEHGGAYAIRPYTDVRQWPLSFIRPQNVFQLRRMPVGRYCSLPGIWGAYAFAPLHGRPTMADVVHSPPKCSSIAADACRALLFPAGKIGGVCNTPLHGRPTMAPDVHSPPKCFPIAADACRALLFSAMNMGGVCNTPLHGRPTMAAVVHSPLKCFPMVADACRALLFPTGNMGGVCFCAPTRASDNGRCRSFAPEMFSDGGGCLSGAIVSYREHGGRMLLRPYTDVRRRRLTFIRPRRNPFYRPSRPIRR